MKRRTGIRLMPGTDGCGKVNDPKRHVRLKQNAGSKPKAKSTIRIITAAGSRMTAGSRARSKTWVITFA